jgi:L-2,4-diaminobutyric acid acetyltransferase
MLRSGDDRFSRMTAGKTNRMYNIRRAKRGDLEGIYALVKETRVLDVHTPYTYWVMNEGYEKLMLVADNGGEIIGYVGGLSAFREPNATFIWQIGVLPSWQRRGIGMALLDKFVESSIKIGATKIYTTISDQNEASLLLFASFTQKISKSLNIIGIAAGLESVMEAETMYEFGICES